ncbi:MAG: hypothetical protein HRT81_06850 [Henriciella sp.]|nr:hypothetical protein [Henriciella sp.]
MKLIVTAMAALVVSALALPSFGDEPDPSMMAPLDLSTPQATAYSMMRAMYQGEAEMVDQVFAPEAQLRRVTNMGELRPDGLQRWRDWVDTLTVGDAHEELFGVTSETYGHLAMVWAPFTIVYQSEMVGCGINQLSMAKISGEWRVVFGMDTNAPEGSCDTFKADYLASLDP